MPICAVVISSSRCSLMTSSARFGSALYAAGVGDPRYRAERAIYPRKCARTIAGSVRRSEQGQEIHRAKTHDRLRRAADLRAIARYARSSLGAMAGIGDPGHSKIDNYDETKLAKASRYGRCPGFFYAGNAGRAAGITDSGYNIRKAVPLRQLCLSCLPPKDAAVVPPPMHG